MAVSLNFHTDAALAVPVSSSAINHLVDGTSDPQDFLFYLGSTVAANKFEANSDPGVDNLAVQITNATPLWLASTARVVNDTARTTAKNGFRFKVQSIAGGGVTGPTEPTWPLTLGQTVVDNEVTWINDGEFHEVTEIKLATSLIGLDTAVAGDNLTLGTVINGDSANAVAVHMRIDDATAIIGQVTELGISVINVLESPI